jgi:hypothetical protein
MIMLAVIIGAVLALIVLKRGYRPAGRVSRRHARRDIHEINRRGGGS